MKAERVRNAYQQSEAQAQIHPVKLIHLLYERVLTHLELAEEGVLQKNFKQRGENLGRAIAIITELNASVKNDDNTETANFLRGLYSSILLELSKVAVTHDVEIIRQATRYMSRLKEIWEETALKEAGLYPDSGSSRGLSNGKGVDTPEVVDEAEERKGKKHKYGSATPPATKLSALSVSI